MLRRGQSWVIVFLAVGALAACKQGDVKVTALTFNGNKAFPDSGLKSILATKSSGWLPWAPKHYFDRAEFDNDLKRITAFYADRGYPDTRVAGVDVQLNDAHDAVKIAITIDEGAPLIAASVTVQGVDALDLPAGARRSLRNLPLHAGGPRDADLLAASKDRVVAVLRNNGYAYAETRVSETTRADGSVDVAFVATPGRLAHFGEVTISGNKSVGDVVIRREITFTPGALYRERQITQTQRAIAGIELFEFAHVNPRRDDTMQANVPVTITVAEAKPRQLQFSIGYGSEERIRSSVTWRHLNFFGGARTATAELKYSGIDKGGRFTLGAPSLFKPGVGLLLSANGWHTSDRTYTSDTIGGSAAIHFDRTSRGADEDTRWTVHTSMNGEYVNEYLRYRVNADVLSDLSRTGDLVALGLDPVLGNGHGTRAAMAFDVQRSMLDRQNDPRRGWNASAHVEHAAPWLGGTFKYNELTLEGRGYVPLAQRAGLAARARGAGLFAASDADIPFSQRYFLGGSTSVRGWGRFEISPLSETGVPIGGRRLLELSLDLRLPLTEKITGVLFADAGSVWGSDRGLALGGLRQAVGIGARYATPVGAIRADLGWQLNPIDGLLVNGKPQARRWRLHLGLGEAF